MARTTLKLKRPITQFELDIDENSLEAVGFIRMSEAKTNGDRLRAMTDEELAEEIIRVQYREGDICPPEHIHNNPLCLQADGCRECWTRWLKSPVEEGDNG